MTAVKKCSRCGETKGEEAFPWRGIKRCAYCAPCDKQYKREHYQRNRQLYADRAKEWRIANPERYLLANAAYYAANKHKHDWRKQSRKPSRIAYSREWRNRNLESQRAVEAAYRSRNRDACNQRIAAWKSAHPEKNREYSFVRGRTERRATPSWADRDAMAAIYHESKRVTQITGVPHEVDHIVPLISPLVCGLHCESNLRIIPNRENRIKGNREWPLMP